VTAVEPSYQ